MKLFPRQFSLPEVIFNLRKELAVLKEKIMNGDYKAAHTAREKLEELEEKNIEFINS